MPNERLEPIPAQPLDYEQFKLIREEIHKEHQYIGTRLSWYVISQSFLHERIRRYSRQRNMVG
jgi:hypothetical protein